MLRNQMTEFSVRKAKRSLLAWLVCICGLAIIAVFTLSPTTRTESAVPLIDRTTVVTEIVKEGDIVRQVRGIGVLVAADLRWIPATNDGIVEEVLVHAGDAVTQDSVILVMSSPDVRQRAVDAEEQLRGAEADLANLQATLKNELLTQHDQLASIQSEYDKADIENEANQEMANRGLVPSLVVKKSQMTVRELSRRIASQNERIEGQVQSAESRTRAQQARVHQLDLAYKLRRKQLEELTVRAGVTGVVQQVDVETGQRIAVGTVMAKIAKPGRLKAELQVPAILAKDVGVGQSAVIDTPDGTMAGKVTRSAPTAVNGAVKVDVELNRESPRGMLPDSSIDGTIEVERLSKVLYLNRPTYWQADQMGELFKFKLLPSGEALRVRVRFGRSSGDRIEVLEGLHDGDAVIVSDTSAWDAYERIRLQ